VKDLHEEALWEAIRRRDASYSSVFFFGVRTTGVYCRPGCPSPTPKRENVVYAFAPATLARAGFRACRRCRPDEPGAPRQAVAMMIDLCRAVEEADTIPGTSALAQRAGLSESAVTRLFKDALGLTPHEYADACRRVRLRAALRSGKGVLDACADAGYGSSSRLYESANGHLGMTPGTFRAGGKGQRISYGTTSTPLGCLLVAATAKGICSVKLGDDESALLAELRQEFANAEMVEADEQVRVWITMLAEYVSGRLLWPELPYDVRATAFQRRVWEYLRAVPSGRTMHYGDVAEGLGQPGAGRAVARACAANPVALVIPCHRIVPKAPGLAGFRWGIERKRKLLQLEGALEATR